MTGVVIALLIVPAVAAVASLWLPGRAAGLVTAAAGIASFALVLTLVPAASHRDLAGPGFLRVDALSVVFLLATAFLYGCVAVYSIGYLGTAAHGEARDERYARRFWAGLNLFAWSMLAAPVMGNLALLWVAIEVTTIVSALLVALEGTDGAAEAAWKYVLLASAGLAIALLGTIFLYYAGSRVLGPSYNLAFGPLLAVAGGCRTPRSGWPSCWPCWGSAPRSACSRCTPGCRTRTRRRPPRCRRCCRGRCSRSASTRSCASTRSRRPRSAPASPATCCSCSAWPRCCWPRCTCWTSGITSGCWLIPAWSTWASWPSG